MFYRNNNTGTVPGVPVQLLIDSLMLIKTIGYIKMYLCEH